MKEPQDHLPKQGPVTLETSRGPITLPHPTQIPAGVIRRANKLGDDLDKFFAIVEGILGEDSDEIARLDELTMEELSQVFAQWGQGASLGE